jgi:hypothetical protein
MPVNRMHSQQVVPVSSIVENPYLIVDWGCPLRDERQYRLVNGTFLRLRASARFL